MKKVWALLFAFVVALLMGCGTQPPKYITEIENNYVLIEPPKKLYGPVARLKPPYSKAYVDAEWEEKERVLFKHIEKQDLLIDNLLIDRKSIDTYVINRKEEVRKLQKVPR